MPDSGQSDLDRLRAEYAARRQRLTGSDRYTLSNPAHLFLVQQRQRAALDLLRRAGVPGLEGRRILEVGCGGGDVLHEYLSVTRSPGLLTGIDLLPDRLREARRWLPQVGLACADGQRLPFAAGSFDVVLQYTAFSSILDDAIRAALAREMLRVLRAPDGVIVWYDFWLNPANPHTRGIRPGEVRRLFPGCTFAVRRVTLAPPLARRLAPASWLLCAILEAVKVLNTHYLIVIRLTTPRLAGFSTRSEQDG